MNNSTVSVPETKQTLGVSAIAQIAIFAAFIAVLGLPGAINVGPVPITLQTLGVMLAGAVLGPWRGAASVAVLLALVAVGLPLLPGGRGGIGVFTGATAGYLIGWVLGAFVVGLIVTYRAQMPGLLRVSLGAVVGGILAIYACGIPIQALITGLSLTQTAVSSLIFLPCDLLKVVLTVLTVLSLRFSYPRAFAWMRTKN